MHAVMDRVHSGFGASCSYFVPTVAPSLMAQSASRIRRGDTVGVAASRSSRSKGIVPPPPGQTRKNSAPRKGQPPSKPPSKATKPQPSSNSSSSAVRPSSGSSAPVAQSSKLPRPAGYLATATPSALVGGAATAAATASALTGKLTGATAAPRASAGAPGVAAGAAALVSPSEASETRSAVHDPDHEEDVDGDGFLDDGEHSSGEVGIELQAQDRAGAAAEGGAEAAEEDEEEDAFPEIKFDLPNPSNVKVKTAEYLQSCVTVSDCPAPRFPEFAVIGRSNVGKSSLINMITGRKDLALVSKQPGKTKCINHFLINGSWYLVDLPGYGFAKVGIQGRQQFDAFTREYFKSRPNLAMVFMLVDASIPPQKIDLEYANWLTDNEIPYTMVFTKADKRRKGVPNTARDSNVTAFKRALLRDLAFLPPSILTSAAKGLGRGELLNFIAGLRIAFEKSGRLLAIRQGML